jgi:pimeloyl-ACP methyl ester carboxylesterase
MLLSCAILPACGDGNNNDAGAPPPPSTALASGVVGPAGGTVAVTDGASPYAGTQIVIPPGALASSTTITIDRAAGELPEDLWAFRFGPAGTTLFAPAQITIKYSRAYPDDFLLPAFAPLRPISFGEPLGADVFDRTAQDSDDRTVTFDTDRLGTYTALLEAGFAEHWRLLAQDRLLATQVATRNVGSERLVVSGIRPGAATLEAGKGSVDAMWTSNRVLILVHSTADDATNFVGEGDLIDGLSSEYDHIVTYQYRSGRPIAENSNWLYNEVKSRAQPGFQADVIGYSMGGVVARYFIERSKDDATRTTMPNFNPGAPAGPLSGIVRNMVTLGSPHQGGVDVARLALLRLSSLLSTDIVEKYFPSFRDLSTGPILNAAYADDPTIPYFLIAGNSNDSILSPLIPGDDDGLVSVESALGVPVLITPEASRVFPDTDHSELHTQAVDRGIRDQIVTWTHPSGT